MKLIKNFLKSNASEFIKILLSSLINSTLTAI